MYVLGNRPQIAHHGQQEKKDARLDLPRHTNVVVEGETDRVMRSHFWFVCPCLHFVPDAPG